MYIMRLIYYNSMKEKSFAPNNCKKQFSYFIICFDIFIPPKQLIMQIIMLSICKKIFTRVLNMFTLLLTYFTNGGSLKKWPFGTLEII